MEEDNLRDSDPTPVRAFNVPAPPSVGWERVKDAFRRDWVQTKADLTGEGARSLNQNAGDTVVQALGTAAMPAADAKTRAPSSRESAKAAAEAFEHMMDVTRRSGELVVKASAVIDEQRSRLSAKVGDLQRHAAEAQAATDKKITDATRAADHDILRQQEKITVAHAAQAVAESAWEQAEREARFGFNVRLEHPDVTWGDALDQSLRAQWEATGDPRPWSEARAGVRSGWEFAHRAR